MGIVLGAPVFEHDSGFPAMRALAPRLARTALHGYVDRIVEHEFSEMGRTVRDRASLRSWMTAFAAASSTCASYAKIRAAATPGEPGKPAKSTAIAYRRILEQLWMIKEAYRRRDGIGVIPAALLTA